MSNNTLLGAKLKIQKLYLNTEGIKRSHFYNILLIQKNFDTA